MIRNKLHRVHKSSLATNTGDDYDIGRLMKWKTGGVMNDDSDDVDYRGKKMTTDYW